MNNQYTFKTKTIMMDIFMDNGEIRAYIQPSKDKITKYYMGPAGIEANDPILERVQPVFSSINKLTADIDAVRDAIKQAHELNTDIKIYELQRSDWDQANMSHRYDDLSGFGKFIDEIEIELPTTEFPDARCAEKFCQDLALTAYKSRKI